MIRPVQSTTLQRGQKMTFFAIGGVPRPLTTRARRLPEVNPGNELVRLHIFLCFIKRPIIVKPRMRVVMKNGGVSSGLPLHGCGIPQGILTHNGSKIWRDG